MSVKQYLALSEQTVSRDALAGSPAYKFYPIKGKLEPEPDYKEETVNEWRGQDIAQGNSGENEERTSTAWKYAFEGRMYPGAELALLFTYLFGASATPISLPAPNAAAARTIFATASEMYGDGTQLLDKAIALHPHTRKPGSTTTYRQDFIGGRIKDGEMSFKGGDAVDMKLNFFGGPWIGAPEQTAISGISFPAAKSFKSVPKVYMGAGATLTAGGLGYTEFLPGTMAAAKPDDLTVKIDPGIEDTYKMNGFEGPSVTERKKMWGLTIEFTIDFSDPSSGWSSYDAWVARFGGIATVPFMLTLDSSEVIPSCEDQTYGMGLYVPRMKLTTDAVDRKNNGAKDKIKIKLESRVDPSINVAAFAKLIF